MNASRILTAALLCVLISVAIAVAQQTSIQKGDKVVVSAQAARVMAAKELVGTIPKGTQFQVEQVSGSWVLGLVTIDGKRVSGWIQTADLTKVPSPATATRSRASSSRATDDMSTYQKMMADYKRLLPHYDKNFDRPGKLFGTTPIRQGMTATITPQIASAAYPDLDAYYYNATMGLAPATERHPQTARLLESLGPVPSPAEICGRVEAALAAATDAETSAAAQAPLFDLHGRVAELRGAGKYAEAVAQAAGLASKCADVYGAEAWQTVDARRLVQTLEQIVKLPAAAQAELATADAATRQFGPLMDRLQHRRAIALADEQFAIRRDFLGEKHPETLAAQAWIACLGRQYGSENVEELHVQLLGAHQALFPNEHPLVARSLSNLGAIRHDRADFDAAVRFTIRALQLRVYAAEQAKRFEADVALLLIRLARTLEEEGRIDESLRCSSMARAVSRTLPLPARNAIVRSYFDDFASLDLFETADGPFHLNGGLPFRPCFMNLVMFGGTPQTKDMLGGSQSSFDSLSMGRTVFDTTTESDEKFPDIPYITATSVYLQQGDYAASERFARKAVEVAKQAYVNRPEFHWRVTQSLQFLSSLLDLTGNTGDAIDALKQAIEYQRPVWEKELSEVKQEVAAGRDMKYRMMSSNGPYVDAHLSLVRMLLKQNDLAEAERLARQAIELAAIPYTLARNELNRKYDGVPGAKMTLATVLMRAGRHDEAGQIYRSVLANDFNNWAFAVWAQQRTPQVLGGLAEILLMQNDEGSRSEALAMSADAFAFVSRGRLLNQMLGANEQLNNYMRLLASSGRPAEAVRLLELAIDSVEAARRSVGGDELNRARYFSELTRFDPFSAIVQLHVSLGSDFSDSFGSPPFGPGPAFDFLERGRGRSLLDLLSRGSVDIDRDLEQLQQRKNDPQLTARIAEIRRKEAQAKETAANVTRELQEFSRNPQKAQSIGADKIAGHMQQLQQRLRQAQEEERQAQRDLFDLARAAREEQTPQPMSAAEVAAALEADELLLAYDISADGSVLIVVHPEGQVDGHVLKWPDGKPVSQRVLAASIAEFFEEISRERADAAAADNSIQIYFPEEIRAAIVPDGVLEQLKQSSRVFVVADGPLHRLPFESLPLDEEATTVLVDQLPPMVYGPSATVLLSGRSSGRQEAKSSSSLQLVALGDPEFGDPAKREAASGEATNPAGTLAAAVESRTRSLSSFGELTPLPGTRAEIETIVSEVKKLAGDANSVRVLTGGEATATNLLRAADSPRLLHLATHGLAEGGRRAWESSLAMAAPARISADDNGFLRLGDLLYQWGGKLSGTDLVVLSACRTARGELESGDGFVALTWGFLFAGANSVVASLWEVDDTATALLMSRFYQNLLGTFDQPREVDGRRFAPGSGMSTPTALREAKRWLRQLPRDEAVVVVERLLGKDAPLPPGEKPFANPFYWGAFVLIGEGHY